MILEHYQIFYYKQKELKEVFYINGSSTNCREFYQVLHKRNNLTRIVEYTRDEDKSTFKETYIRR